MPENKPFKTVSNFPVKNAYQSVYGGNYDAFIAKFNSSGGLVFSTYFGGSSDDAGYAKRVDNSANAFITRKTLSANFPIQNAYQPSIGGSQTTDALLIDVATGATKTCTVNNTSDDAATGGSFRNALSQSLKCDIINFNFGGSSTINIVNTPLPEVPADVTINGVCNNNQPLITAPE